MQEQVQVQEDDAAASGRNAPTLRRLAMGHGQHQDCHVLELLELLFLQLQQQLAKLRPCGWCARTVDIEKKNRA